MNGRFISSRYPYLPIRLTLRGRSYDLEAMLDTGFDGGVLVPRGLLSDDLPPNNRITWTLADGTEVPAPLYLGRVMIASLGPYPVTISEVGDEVLAGSGLIRQISVTLDHGERVIVEP